MGKKTKKVIMFIVEGPTDEDTLSPVIKRLFQNNNILILKLKCAVTDIKKAI